MSVTMMMTVGALTPVVAAAAAYATVAAIYWWEKRSGPTLRAGIPVPRPPSDFVEGALVRQRIRWP